MCTADEKFFTPLSASEYRLLDIICTLSKKNQLLISQEDLARYAQTSVDSIGRAVKALKAVGAIKIERTRRNFGKTYINNYVLAFPSHSGTTPQNCGVDKGLDRKNADDLDRKNAVTTADIDIAINNNIENKTTSYFMFEPEHGKKKKKVVFVGRGWQDDDMDLAGFGLFDDEVPASQKQAPVSKRSAKTRHQRPQDDWTALDIAVEFAARVYQQIPGVVNPVNTIELQKIIGKNRKQFNLNPLIELELMKLFFADPWFKNEAKNSPHYIQGRFLKFFTSHLHVALKNLGLHSDLTITEEQALSAKQEEFIYASDGTPFDNSMPGRKDLDLYEARLRRTADDETTIQS